MNPVGLQLLWSHSGWLDGFYISPHRSVFSPMTLSAGASKLSRLAVTVFRDPLGSANFLPGIELETSRSGQLQAWLRKRTHGARRLDHSAIASTQTPSGTSRWPHSVFRSMLRIAHSLGTSTAIAVWRADDELVWFI